MQKYIFIYVEIHIYKYIFIYMDFMCDLEPFSNSLKMHEDRSCTLHVHSIREFYCTMACSSINGHPIIIGKHFKEVQYGIKNRMILTISYTLPS